MNRNLLKAWPLLLAAVLMAASLAGCSRTTQSAPQKPAVAVTVGSAAKKDMPNQVEAVGNVQAYNSVVVIPQVTGKVIGVHFKEGQDVKAGDLLATIDPAPFEQKLAQARAQLAHDADQSQFAASSADRSARLFQIGAISRQEYEQATSSSSAQGATVNQAQAAVESARIDLNNTYVRSPIDGRTGAILANVGALATVNQTQLVVVNQIQPIYVKFTVPEKDLAAIRAAQAQGPLKVTASIPEQGVNVADGALTFIDNTVDAAAGAVQMKAAFPNADRALWPGQFVRVTLVLGVQPQAVTVPAEAVALGQSGRYVFVVKDDMTVEMRPVEQERVIGGLAVIGKGLAGNEKVVTDGQVNLRDGAKVTVKNAAGAPAGKQGGEGQ